MLLALSLLPLLTGASVLSFAAQPSTTALQSRPAETIQSGGSTLDVGDYAIPVVADWNGDGRNDLLVGYRYADKIALFLNVGSPSVPFLQSAGNLQVAGLDIMVPGGTGGCGAPAPWASDFDADGDKDLLVGSGADGSVLVFKNNGTDTGPVLAPGARLALWNGDHLTVGSRATPCFSDWDGDTLPDLLCGAGDGTVFLFKNIGTMKSPMLTAGLRLIAGGIQLNLGSRSVVRICDWDGDGRRDIVGSSSTGVYWCRNVGTTTAPVLQAPLHLAVPNTSGQFVPIYTSNRMRLDLADWNNDGLPDLLLGNTDGTVLWFECYEFAVTSFGRSGDGRLTIRWNSAPSLKYSILTGPSVTTCKDVIASGIASGGKTTSWTGLFITRQQYFRLRTP